MWVQPREIREAVFRVLFSAGADPAEAHEGSHAVLRAEGNGESGLDLLRKLLDADWTLQHEPTRIVAAASKYGMVKELVGAPRNPLRNALGVLDLASSSASSELCAVRIRNASIPMLLWNDISIRRAALLARPIIVAAHPANAKSIVGGGADADNIRFAGMGDDSHVLHAEGVEWLRHQSNDANTTTVIILPAVSPMDPSPARVPVQPLKVRKDNWQTIYRMSRTYLVPDS